MYGQNQDSNYSELDQNFKIDKRLEHIMNDDSRKQI